MESIIHESTMTMTGSLAEVAQHAARDSMTVAERNNRALQHNQKIVDDIVREWGCTSLEAWIALEYDCNSLEDTIRTIEMSVTYNRLVSNMFPGAVDFLKDEMYKDLNLNASDSFLLAEAQTLAEEQAYMFVYEWEQYDDYDTMSAEEVERVLFGADQAAAI